MSEHREIHLVRDSDGEWTAREPDVDVAARGETREAALDALDEAIAAETDRSGGPTDEGLETDRDEDDEPPDVFQ